MGPITRPLLVEPLNYTHLQQRSFRQEVYATLAWTNLNCMKRMLLLQTRRPAVGHPRRSAPIRAPGEQISSCASMLSTATPWRCSPDEHRSCKELPERLEEDRLEPCEAAARVLVGRIKQDLQDRSPKTLRRFSHPLHWRSGSSYLVQGCFIHWIIAAKKRISFSSKCLFAFHFKDSRILQFSRLQETTKIPSKFQFNHTEEAIYEKQRKGLAAWWEEWYYYW